MEVCIERTGRTRNMCFDGAASNLLKKLGLNPNTVLISRNGKLITEDEKLRKNDKIKIMSVVSGG